MKCSSIRLNILIVSDRIYTLVPENVDFVFKNEAIKILKVPRRKFHRLGLKPFMVSRNEFNVEMELYRIQDIEAIQGSTQIHLLKERTRNKELDPNQLSMF